MEIDRKCCKSTVLRLKVLNHEILHVTSKSFSCFLRSLDQGLNRFGCLLCLLNYTYATVEHRGFRRFILSGVRPTGEFVCVQNKGTLSHTRNQPIFLLFSQRVECRKFITLSVQCVYNTMSVTESITRFVGDNWASCFAGRIQRKAQCNGRPSVRLSRRHTHRDSPGGSMRRCQHTFRPDSKQDRYTCFYRFRSLENTALRSICRRKIITDRRTA